MKKMKKVLALGACAAMLVTASVMGTLAFLTAEETITNTFTVGKVQFGDDTNNDGDTDDDGDIKPLDEAKVNEYGVADTSVARVQENTYKLIPDHTYVKDPTLHIHKDSEACYVFVTVNNGISSIESAEGDGYTKIADQLTANGWKSLSTTYEDVYVYSDSTGAVTVSGEDVNTTIDETSGNNTLDLVIFENFKISKDAEQADFEALVGEDVEDDDKAKIIINAYAVQAEGFTDAEDAWVKNFVTTTP